MTTPFDRLSLFDAMDVAADLLRHTNCGYSPADDQLVFRKLQKQRLPRLTREQFQTLFAEWQERHAAKAEINCERAIASIKATAEAYATTHPPSPPFKCVCSAETKDPDDLAFMRVHVAHCVAASEREVRRRIVEAVVDDAKSSETSTTTFTSGGGLVGTTLHCKTCRSSWTVAMFGRTVPLDTLRTETCPTCGAPTTFDD